MKMALGYIMVSCVCLAAVVALPVADPGPGLLRVPRIYNALISSDAKLQPSRAFPYSSPVYQPFGLGPEPVFSQWQPPAYAVEPVEHPRVEAQDSKLETSTPALSTETEESTKTNPKTTTAPLTFYPRSFGYYQPQPFLPYTYPIGPQPFVYGSPFGFGQTLFKYPDLSFDGYYGGLYSPGFEHIGGAHEPENIEVQKMEMKTDDSVMTKESNKSKSDSVDVRETEFLSDAEENEGSPETLEPKKGTPKSS